MAQATRALETSPSSKTYPQPQFRKVPIAAIEVTQNNFRKDFDEADLKELAESVAKHGVAEPLLVRTLPKGWVPIPSRSVEGKFVRFNPNIDGGTTVFNNRAKADQQQECDRLNNSVELIAGERRLRAAKLANLVEVPAMVYEIDDETADELMVLENLQRRDLSPLEYADGFGRMISKHGYTVERLAEKAHKGTTFIRDLLHLTKLPENAREGLRGERITKSVAVLIGTIPDEGQRKKFAEQVLRGNAHGSWKRDTAFTFREAKELKEREYMKVLSGAPFPLDQQLDPAWPYSCKTCPHFAGNASSAQQQGKRTDVCLNPPHYEIMVELHGRSLMEKAKAAGKTVLEPSATKNIFEKEYYGSDKYRVKGDAIYVDVNASVHDYKTSKNVQWGTIAKKAGLEKVLAVDPRGQTHTLVKKSAAEKAAAEQGIKRSYSPSGPRSSVHSIPTVSEGKRKAIAISRTAAVKTAVASALKAKWGKASLTVWRTLLALELDIVSMGDGGDELVVEVLGGKGPQKRPYDFRKKFFATHIQSLRTVESLQGLLASLIIADRLSSCTGDYASSFTKEDTALCLSLGVDVKKLERQAIAKFEAEAKAAKQKPKKAAKRRSSKPVVKSVARGA
jgi:ParB/RepB/Spo0J family partition protein